LRASAASIESALALVTHQSVENRFEAGFRLAAVSIAVLDAKELTGLLQGGGGCRGLECHSGFPSSVDYRRDGCFDFFGVSQARAKFGSTKLAMTATVVSRRAIYLSPVSVFSLTPQSR
jgi:hypothetical protein